MVYGRVRLVLLAAIVALAAGCGNRDSNPVGSDMVTRSSGRLVTLPLLPAVSGDTRFEAIFPLVFGASSELAVGRTSGLLLRSLIRVQINADSLARARGGVNAAGLNVLSFSISLRPRETLRAGMGNLRVHRPGQSWNEASVFVDTLTFVEASFASSPLSGATVTTQGDSLLRVHLPPEYVMEAIRAKPSAAQVDFLLYPEEGSAFVTHLISRDNTLPGNEQKRPKIEMRYAVGDTTLTASRGVSADTYWVARDGAGPDPGTLVLASGIRFSPIFQFNIPDSIPAGATVTAARLFLDVDTEKSVFNTFNFAVARVDLNAETGDTTYTRFNTWRFEAQVDSFVLNQSLAQSWISRTVPNRGIALRSRSDNFLNWVLFRNPRLKLIYSLPPDL